MCWSSMIYLRVLFAKNLGDETVIYYGDESANGRPEIKAPVRGETSAAARGG